MSLVKETTKVDPQLSETKESKAYQYMKFIASWKERSCDLTFPDGVRKTITIDENVCPPSGMMQEIAPVLCDIASNKSGGDALDIGTGTGIEALISAYAGMSVTTVELCAEASACARKNIDAWGLSDKVELISGRDFKDVGPELKAQGKTYQLISCVGPWQQKKGPFTAGEFSTAIQHIPFDENGTLISTLFAIIPEILATDGVVISDNSNWAEADPHSNLFMQHLDKATMNWRRVYCLPGVETGDFLLIAVKRGNDPLLDSICNKIKQSFSDVVIQQDKWGPDS